MACSVQLSGLSNQNCYKSKGGIKVAYIANAGTFEPTISGGVITSGTTTGFHKYEFRKNTGSMTSTLNVDNANGTNYVSTELVLNFGKMQTTNRIEVAALAIGDLEVVVEDANGEMYFLGMDTPVNASAGDGQTGTAATDGNYYSITLTDESDEFPLHLSDDMKDAFKAIV